MHTPIPSLSRTPKLADFGISTVVVAREAQVARLYLHLPWRGYTYLLRLSLHLLLLRPYTDHGCVARQLREGERDGGCVDTLTLA
eukprot:scaffold64807_cov66-Phaeocystis_antarctica.AAC.4